MTERSEAVRYIDYLFKRQFEGIDFSLIESVDIYSMFQKSFEDDVIKEESIEDEKANSAEINTTSNTI